MRRKYRHPLTGEMISEPAYAAYFASSTRSHFDPEEIDEECRKEERKYKEEQDEKERRWAHDSDDY